MDESAIATARAIAAAVKRDAIAPERWHMIAALLLADGFDGESLVAMASLTSSANASDVAQYLPRVLAEIGAPEIGEAEALETVAGLRARHRDHAPFTGTRYLANHGWSVDWAGKSVDALQLIEAVDEDSPMRPADMQAVQVFEEALRAGAPHIGDALVAQLFGPNPS